VVVSLRRKLLDLVDPGLALCSMAGAFHASVNRLPEHFHVPLGLATSVAVSAFSVEAGFSLEAQGLNPRRAPRGALLGFAAAAPIAVGMVIGARIERLRHYYIDERISNAARGRAAYEVFVRIPLATALPEEMIFRGAALAAISRSHGPITAVTASSFLFGLWHIVPTLRKPQAGSNMHRALRVAGAVAVTSCAGLLLAWLRLRTGSLMAPWVAHGVANAAGFAAAWLSPGRSAISSPRGW
jgi:membrane protease YdiL (CAAX protease family)